MKLGKTAYVVLNGKHARIFVDKQRLDGSFEVDEGWDRRDIEADVRQLFVTQAPQFPINQVAVFDVIEGGAAKVAQKIGPAPAPKFSA